MINCYVYTLKYKWNQIYKFSLQKSEYILYFFLLSQKGLDSLNADVKVSSSFFWGAHRDEQKTVDFMVVDEK